MAAQRYAGLMSGTSLDGVDAVLAEFDDGRNDGTAAPSFRLLATHFAPFPDALRSELAALQAATPDEMHRAAVASVALARTYADAVKALLAAEGIGRNSIQAVGCHGQTVRHRPELGFTVQLNHPALLAELCGLTVVADFRSRDVAAGGQGAPLLPAFHAANFTSGDHDRVILNLGGFANVTALPRAHSRPVIGFDTGTASVLLDDWAGRHLKAAFDQDGAWAASGRVDEALLASLLADPWFKLPPPKSTGRDYFHLGWVDRHGVGKVRPQDVQATLAELSAASVAEAVARWCFPGHSAGVTVYACGGGTHNRDLMARLAQHLDAAAGAKLSTTEELGLHPDWVEAAGFAWFAKQALARQPGNLPSVTGAAGPRVLGAIYPA
jgi:anhydro-N-acetylmuramic acid kinase